MKVYIVWAGYNYYPSGPGDLKMITSDRETAESELEKLKEENKFDWYEVTPEFVN